jgi:hypothetical protein
MLQCFSCKDWAKLPLGHNKNCRFKWLEAQANLIRDGLVATVRAL